MSEARLVYNRRLLAWLGLHSETVSKQARGHRRIRHPVIRVTNQLRPLAAKQPPMLWDSADSQAPMREWHACQGEGELEWGILNSQKGRVPRK